MQYYMQQFGITLSPLNPV